MKVKIGRSPFLAAILAAAVCAVAGVAVAKDDPRAPAAEGKTGGKNAPAEKATVTIDGFRYVPAIVTVKKGGSVTFTNTDATPHTVTPREGAKFAGSGRISNGESKTIVFDEVGEQKYFCSIHPSMQGSVAVVEK